MSFILKFPFYFSLIKGDVFHAPETNFGQKPKKLDVFLFIYIFLFSISNRIKKRVFDRKLGYRAKYSQNDPKTAVFTPFLHKISQKSRSKKFSKVGRKWPIGRKSDQNTTKLFFVHKKIDKVFCSAHLFLSRAHF